MKIFSIAVLLTLTVGTFSQKVFEASSLRKDEHHQKHKHNRQLCREFLKTNKCDEGEHCRVRDGKPMCVRCAECGNEEESKPVCGSNGVTYKSHCLLRREACLNNERIHIVCEHQCPCEDTKSDPEEQGIVLTTKDSDEYLTQHSEDSEEAMYRKTIEHEMKKNRKWMKWTSLIKSASENIKKEALSWKDKTTCSKEDLVAMPSRLLDWFHVLKADNIKAERRLRKKRDVSELSYLGSLSLEDVKLEKGQVCHLPVSWMFDFLDSNNNEELGHEEMIAIEDIPYEHCMKPFFDSCNVGSPANLHLTKQEFCNCFTNEETPCRKQLLKVPTKMVRGRLQPLLGAWQPHCDEDGFFHPIQCRESQCWCVDRLGVEIEDSRKTGEVQCSDNTEALDNGEEEDEEEEEAPQ